MSAHRSQQKLVSDQCQRRHSCFSWVFVLPSGWTARGEKLMVVVSLIAWPPVGGWPGAIRHPGMGELVPVSSCEDGVCSQAFLCREGWT